MNLLRSEAIKLYSVRTTWVMLGIGLLLEALFAGLYTGLAPLLDIGEIEDISTGIGMLLLLVVVLGVLAITTEFRHGTSSSTFLVSPRRWPVLVAKLGATLLLGLVAGLAFVAVNAGLALPIYADRGGTLPSSGDLVSIYAGVVASLALLCAFGYGVGTVVRNQVGAIIAAIAFFFVLPVPVELLLSDSLADYFPASAIGALHGNLEGDSGMSALGGGLVLAAWTAALLAIGTVLVCRRDVTE